MAVTVKISKVTCLQYACHFFNIISNFFVEVAHENDVVGFLTESSDQDRQVCDKAGAGIGFVGTFESHHRGLLALECLVAWLAVGFGDLVDAYDGH